MPVASQRLSPEAAGFRGELTAPEVNALAADRGLRVLQFTSPSPDETWDLLNERLFARRGDVMLRAFGSGFLDCDLSFLLRLPNLRRFSADSLQKAKGVEHVAALPKLESLGIGIYNLDSFSFLDDVPAGLEELELYQTKSKKPTLSALERFRGLKTLSLEGQQKQIELIEGLSKLEDVTLRSITTDGLEYLRPLNKLWSVDLKLGGTNDLSALEGKTSIKYLELWQIRDLKNIDVVSSLTGLQSLFLQSLPHIKALPDLSGLKKLRRVMLQNMKGLKDVSALAKAPALAEFIHMSAKGMSAADYAGMLKNKALKTFSAWTGAEGKNEEIKAAAAKAGKGEWERSEFVFK